MDDGEFEGPLFKRLSRNDSGLGKGHQAGFVIPVELRLFFPELPAPTAAQPAPSVPLRAILPFDAGAPQSANTSLQYQQSVERLVGKKCVSPCTSRWSPDT